VAGSKADFINGVVVIEDEPVSALGDLGLCLRNVWAVQEVLSAEPVQELPGCLATVPVIAYPVLEVI
jgi:hypothetical protein